MITTVRRCDGLCSRDSVTKFNPFGDTRVRDILKDFNFAGKNCDDNEVTKVLLLGCGDLRNTLIAATTKDPHNVEIHLNDFHSSVLARNVIILKIISAHDFNPDNTEDFGSLWDVWYNIDWPEKTRKRFLSVVKELINEILPENVSIPNKDHLEKFKSLWSNWLSVLSKNESDSQSLLRKICCQRNQCMIDCSETMLPGYLQQQAMLKNTDLFTASADVVADAFTKCEGIIGLDPCIKNKIYNEVMKCYKEASCRLQKNVKTVCVNPTLLDPKTHEWKIFLATPFDGYLPMENGDFVSSGEEILIQACSKILKNWVSSYRSRMQSTKIVFHWEEAIEFCYSDANKFDVIHCSNFVESIGFANLIVACSPKLSVNPHAILYTEVVTDSENSAYRIIEESLCAPLSMIPIIYGLRLADRVELNDCVKDYLPSNGFQNTRPENLCWQKVPAFKNIELSPSPVLNRCLTKLAKLCHVTSFAELPYKMSSVVNQLYYTPLTFRFILDSMIERLGHNWGVKDMVHVKIAPQFKLAGKTFEDWKNKKKIQKFTADIKTKFPASVSLLRLVVAPKASLSNRSLCGPDVHFIDDFQVEFEHFSNGMQVKNVSFLLSPDHGLDNACNAVIVDVLNGDPIFLLGSIGSMRVEEYNLPYPIDQSQSQFLMNPNEEMNMKVESCIESEDAYTMKISIGSDGIVSELKVITHEQAPCESCHDITVSLVPPSQIKPLTLSFPFPILSENVQATLHPESRHVDLVLKKSLHEPWPRDFHAEKQKWTIDDLVPWKNENLESGKKFNCIQHHFADQLSSRQGMDSSPLQSFRLKLATMMMTSDLEYVVYGRNDDRYLLKLHRPLLTSPMGSPILLITALDESFVKKKKKTPTNTPLSEEEVHHAAINNIVFPFDTPGNVFEAETEEEFQLLRFILRFNSTRIEPSKWQKEKIPLGGDSPWLATFLAPLKQDPPGMGSNGDCCLACDKISWKLKRCSRCRFVFYCSVECQRSHWPMHKLNCKKA